MTHHQRVDGSVKGEPRTASAAASVAACVVAGVVATGCDVEAGDSDVAGCFFCFFDAALPLPPAAAFAAAAASFLAAFCARIFFSR